MKEILCRGKCLNDEDWVEGFYVYLFDGKGHESHRIYTGYAETDCGDFYPDFYEVHPETVGRFTGQYDKNQKRIFEGHVVERKWDWLDSPDRYVIEYDEEECRFLGTAIGRKGFVSFDGDGDRFEIVNDSL